MNKELALYIEITRQLKKARQKSDLSTLEVALELGLDHTRADVAIGQRERQGVKTLHKIIEHCLAVDADPKKVVGAAIDKYLQAKQRTANRKTG